ncbi:MAG TPA: thioredoxin domain-containing protein [Solirubrobacteraceae bacterium]
MTPPMRPDVAMGGPRRPVGDLGSAPVPPPGADDHIRGPEDAVFVIEYADFECPYCAALNGRLATRRLRRVFRHFPVRSSHPRAWAAACAAEAAGIQDRFWEMHDLLFADQSRLEDPHLWERAEQLELDLARFDEDRRSALVVERVKSDFRAGVRAGVVTTPTLFRGDATVAGRLDDQRLDELFSSG